MKYLSYGLLVFIAIACTSGPQKINVGKDQCQYCRMTIMETNFATQAITPKGKVYKYDDIKCMLMAQKQNAKKLDGAAFYLANYYNGNEYIPSGEAFLVKSNELKSPMMGNVAATKSKKEQDKLITDKSGTIIEFGNVLD